MNQSNESIKILVKQHLPQALRDNGDANNQSSLHGFLPPDVNNKLLESVLINNDSYQEESKNNGDQGEDVEMKDINDKSETKQKFDDFAKAMNQCMMQFVDIVKYNQTT
eukprot:CAMPEP_0176355444 /NCGR_PEP_ID=MMETSP0126-20121128/13296_1 /TAXON_ID=141414 ORGANISM="Strombidinopsis acuminatum, Strain SPMC142" /NCGR_SAMPLE_ID=MMETSP0126 /ASSEMBLY_ACC=CAM_ASM_000229 /LENGTH=108 /DNA_ID=CAMNT_0017708091 /DNA_START=320 /DNA_END=646 /DNA_ORIENTATION=+